MHIVKCFAKMAELIEMQFVMLSGMGKCNYVADWKLL